ncbi:MAG: electron transfer flavoprotein subunit alpha/FixB family protein [Desulfotignum sp.]|nr:electron transfer flavoprotein subunit alpha/FixB family protein [Desulfotignum sp.]MCF8137836.1 electron transfer flavoprotein subunit alpha/FixB family protein [Desulfotignum sp.]
MKKTCILQDTETPEKTTDLLAAAVRMYGRDGFESHVVLVNAPPATVTGRCHHVIQMTESLAAEDDPRALAEILEILHQTYGFDSILIPATTLGKMIAPRLAWRLKTGLATGVTDITVRDGQLEITRPAGLGTMLETILQEGQGPVIMTIRINAFEYTQKQAVPTRISPYSRPVTVRSTLTRLGVEQNIEPRDIRDFEVLVAGGGGAIRCFPALEPLADALNGAVAASRKLVDLGIAKRNIQVGQSGKTVTPKVYLALGIHGSMQHLAGLRGAASILAVNTSSHAPICRVSDLVVQGDACEFIEKLMGKLMHHPHKNT